MKAKSSRSCTIFGFTLENTNRLPEDTMEDDEEGLLFR